MKALLLFHFRVGVRVAVRSFIPLFAAVLCLIIFQWSPIATVRILAFSIFAPHPSAPVLVLVGFMAFLLPLWASPRLSLGLNGWFRHLGFSRRANKRGLLLSLALSQIPLWISLAVLGFTAHFHGRQVGIAVPRLFLLLAAGVYFSLPVRRRFWVMALALPAAACAFSPRTFALAYGILLLAAADLASGDIRQQRRHKTWSTTGSLFEFRVAWRALGRRLPLQYIRPMPVAGITMLFAYNNRLSGYPVSGAARFGACLAAAIFLYSTAVTLSKRRPAWPWARSFPVSSSRRIASDAFFLGIHSLPILAATAFLDFYATCLVFMVLPFLSIRAAGLVRQAPGRRAGIKHLLECFGTAALVALLPWTVLLTIAAVVPAFFSARSTDSRQKVSSWLELHYLAAGDPLNWSDR